MSELTEELNKKKETYASNPSYMRYYRYEEYATHYAWQTSLLTM
jgi:hypothetical protein